MVSAITHPVWTTFVLGTHWHLAAGMLTFNTLSALEVSIVVLQAVTRNSGWVQVISYFVVVIILHHDIILYHYTCRLSVAVSAPGFLGLAAVSGHLLGG